MTIPTALFAALVTFFGGLMTVGGIAVLDYSAVPVLVSTAGLLGIIHMPASMAWLSSPPAVAAGAGLYGLSIVSARMKRPPRLKAVERAVGLPFTALSVAAVALASASRAGLEGHLLSSTASDAVIHTGSYTANDVTVLALTGLVATPMAVAGKGMRAITRRAPGAKTIQSAVAVAGVSASAILMRLPAEVRLFVGAAMLLIFIALIVGTVRRAIRLLGWWQDDAAGVTPRERLAVVVEALIPGAGDAILGNVYRSVPRFILTALLLVVVVVFGIFGLPLFLFFSLGRALSLAHEIVTEPPPPPSDDRGDGDDDKQPRRGHELPFGRPRSQPALVQARTDMDW